MSQVIRIAICDDTKIDAERLARFVRAGAKRRLIEVALSFFQKGEDLLRVFAPGLFEIVFLDIYMTGITGVDVAHRIREKDGNCILMFTTSSMEHALEGYDVQALHYLIKPISQHKLDEALNRSFKLLEDRLVNICTVMVERKQIDIPLQEIMYVEAQNKYCNIHTISGEVFSPRMAIEKLKEQLPMPPFLHCHRSYIANLYFVHDIGSDFIMKNGDTVCIRQLDAKYVKEKYMQFLMDIARDEEASPLFTGDSSRGDSATPETL